MQFSRFIFWLCFPSPIVTWVHIASGLLKVQQSHFSYFWWKMTVLNFRPILRFGCFWLAVVEVSGFEPLTSCLQSRRSTSWAIPPLHLSFISWHRSFHNYCLMFNVKCSMGLWWAILDLNQGPHPYQGCALTTWANSPKLLSSLMISFTLIPRVA